MNPGNTSARRERFRWIAAIVTCCFCVIIAAFMTYRIVTLPFEMAQSLPPGTHDVNMMFMVDGPGITSIFTIGLCFILACIGVLLQPKSILIWVLSLVGIAIAVASWPLWKWALRLVIAKYHLVDVG